ncbi:MAG: hypothetical protein JWM82_3366 [Myxococcales bacterium]|nr:hypothetical protein [Myxococcales bacterium]
MRLALFAALLATGGCERALGIHGSHARDASAGTDGGPGDATLDAVRDAIAEAASNDTAAVEVSPAEDRPSSVDAHDGPDGQATSDAASDAASTDAPVLMCAAAPKQTVTLYEYADGPNGPNVTAAPDACGYSFSVLPKSHSYAAVSPAVGKAAACGACLVVENLAGSKSAEVQVIEALNDNTSGGVAGVVSVEASVLSALSPNGSQVRVHYAPCSYGGTIQAAFKETNFAAAILFNQRTRITKVDIRGAGALAWTPMTLAPYNYWEPPAGYAPNATTAALRLTDEAGSVVQTPDLPIGRTFHDTGVQFPVCTPR